LTLRALSRVSVVIPALNEARNLRYVLPLIPSLVHEIILVDGESTDGTPEVARSLRPEIVIVSQEGQGKGSALRTGLSAATGDIVVMLDADGSTDPREIPLFVDALLAGADFVKGSRFIPGGGTADMPLYRKLGNAAFVRTVRLLFGGRFTDLCYGYNACWTRALPSLRLDATGFEIETQMSLRALWVGLRVAEVPSFEAARVHGSSNLRTFQDGWRVTRQIWDERFRSRVARGSATRSPNRLIGVPIMADPGAGDAKSFSSLFPESDPTAAYSRRPRTEAGNGRDAPEVREPAVAVGVAVDRD
jgi:glycosyltransferase involved in cell wall biosynthesis